MNSNSNNSNTNNQHEIDAKNIDSDFDNSNFNQGKNRRDWTDLIFRILFSLIFIGLGGEHIVDDRLIMHLMPKWVPEPRFFSVFAGLMLLSGGTMIILGWELKKASLLLGAFLIGVTLVVHAPALFETPSHVHPDDQWMWIVLQRSNFVKNLCLLGVCFHLYYYKPRCYSLDSQLEKCQGDFKVLWCEIKKHKLGIFQSSNPKD